MRKPAKKMGASKLAKRLGAKDLTQISIMSNTSLNTLGNWHKYNPKRFKAVVLGCVAQL
jgi:hypothetical protein